MDLPEQFLNGFQPLAGSPWFVPPAAAAALVLFLLLLWWLYPKLRRWRVHQNIRRRVARMGDALIGNVQLPDAVDGQLHIDYLVLQGERILVVDVKRYDGLIYGGEKIDQWTQVVHRKNFRFRNPLAKLQHRVHAVQAVVPDVQVDGVVLFAGNGHFPKRVPEGVLTLGDIPRKKRKAPVSERMRPVWDRLKEYRGGNGAP